MNYKQIASFIRQRGQGFIPDKIEIFCKYLAGWLASCLAGRVMFHFQTDRWDTLEVYDDETF